MRSPDTGHVDKKATVCNNKMNGSRRRSIVKKVRECFHILITAVICLMVSMIPGKNAVSASIEEDVAGEVLSTGNDRIADRFAQKMTDKVRNLWISSYIKRNRMWKKLFFWMQGPGDKKAVFLLDRNKKTAVEIN